MSGCFAVIASQTAADALVVGEAVVERSVLLARSLPTLGGSFLLRELARRSRCSRSRCSREIDGSRCSRGAWCSPEIDGSRCSRGAWCSPIIAPPCERVPSVVTSSSCASSGAGWGRTAGLAASKGSLMGLDCASPASVGCLVLDSLSTNAGFIW